MTEVMIPLLNSLSPFEHELLFLKKVAALHGVIVPANEDGTRMVVIPRSRVQVFDVFIMSSWPTKAWFFERLLRCRVTIAEGC